MSAQFSDAFLANVRDYLDAECDWWGMDEHNTLPQLRAALEAATAQSSLAVIDAEDREQVERLAGGFGMVDVDWLQSRLREFASPTPPRPDEPMGLGAVVEDDEGRHWVRADEVTENDFIVWHCTKNAGLDWRDWSDITAVRVLSEGVSDD